MSGGSDTTFTPGMQLETNKGGEGAIGCFAHAVGQPSQRLLLSCGHVLFAGAGLVDDFGEAKVYSPPSSSSWCRHTRIAVTRGKPSDGFRHVEMKVTPPGGQPAVVTGFDTDAGIAGVLPNVTFANTVPGIGAIMGIPASGLGFGVPAPDALPGPDDYLRFYSPLDKTVHWGTAAVAVEATAEYLDPPLGPVPSPLIPARIGSAVGDEMADARPNLGLFLVIPRPPPNPQTFQPVGASLQQYYGGSTTPLRFGSGGGSGESGSVVLNRHNQVVGLVVRSGRGNPVPKHQGLLPYRRIGTFATVCQIKPVVEKLGITIPDAPDLHHPWTSPKQSAGAAAAFPSQAEIEALERGIDEVEDELSQSPAGALVLAKIREHGREGRRLVNTVRRVTLAWHRAKGPAYLYHAIESLRDPQHRIPRSIDAVPWRQLLADMAVVLGAHGSDELRADVERYAPFVLDCLSDLTSLRDAPGLLAEASLP